jgi:uncharacterized membrane protein
LAIPTLTMRALDCVPPRRGMGASVQLFVQTGFNAFIAAVLAPLVWGSPMSLALAAAGLFVCAGLAVLLAARLQSRKGDRLQTSGGIAIASFTRRRTARLLFYCRVSGAAGEPKKAPDA